MPGAFEDKVIDFTDEQVVKCNAQAVNNTLLNNDHNDDCK